jgi:hypothetical protein
MQWIKLSTGWRDDPARLAAQHAGGAGALVLYIDLCLWSAQYETDGVLPSAAVIALHAGDGELTALVDAGLLRRGRNGDFTIVRYCDEQETRDDLDRKRDAGRQRAKRYYDRTNAVTNAVPNAVSNGEGRSTEVRGKR